MIAAGDHAGAARVASAFVVGQRQARRQQEDPYFNREARFHGALHSKHDDALPADAEELRRAGGMRWVEWAAGERAKDEEIKFQREFWLPVLEGWLANVERDFEGEGVKWVRSDLRREIKRLRRCLGFTQTPEERRERTRQRCERYGRARRLTDEPWPRLGAARLVDPVGRGGRTASGGRPRHRHAGSEAVSKRQAMGMEQTGERSDRHSVAGAGGPQARWAGDGDLFRRQRIRGVQVRQQVDDHGSREGPDVSLIV